MTNFDALFKVGISGIDTDLKKRIFLETANVFNTGYKNTIGVGFGIKTIYFGNRCFKLQVWDFSSRDYFAYIRPAYLKGTYGVIINIDQFNISNLPKYFNEILLNCGQIPIILVVECDSQFKRSFERQIEQIDRSVLNFSTKVIENPLEVFADLTEKLVSRYCGENTDLQIDLYINDSLSRVFSNEELNNSIYLFLNIIQNQKYRSEIDYNHVQELQLNRDSQNSSVDYELKHISTKNKNFKHFIKIIKSLEIELDKENRYAIIKKCNGLFKIDILKNSVKFIPRECENCKNKCYFLNRSLCIEKRTIGWSNLNLNDSQIFILSIIYAIKSNNLPSNILEQIKRIILTTWRYNQAFNTVNGLFIIIKTIKKKIKIAGQKYISKLIKKIFSYGIDFLRHSILDINFKNNLKNIIYTFKQKLCELKHLNPKGIRSISTLRDEMLQELNRLRQLMLE
ncbi:MAG: hypothetical protein EU547_03215 [Promethearchaeota archaeon]|nr:MAG: hypothetical protein EU547_03215 [Candidatus Lokiarchaeota archaeon]